MFVEVLSYKNLKQPREEVEQVTENVAAGL